jgi:single-strand DNA-binding protein
MYRNHFLVIGHAGSAPILRQTLNGGVVATVNVATNYRHKDGSGQWSESTEWHRITAFDDLAKQLHESVAKGTRVGATGYMRTRTFVDAHHQQRYAHELVATRIETGDAADHVATGTAPSRPVAGAQTSLGTESVTSVI